MNEQDDTSLKLADFGFARRFNLAEPDASMKTKCGTPAFVPPELITGTPYGPKCDIWSAGCTLFMLLSGRAPFSMNRGGKNAMFYRIRAGDYVFYNSYWSDVSINARKLVLSMLQVDPKARVSAKEALESDWMSMQGEDLKHRSLDNSLREIISFNARRKLKGAISAVMVAVSGKFWDIETTSMYRESLFDSNGAINGDCERDKPEIQTSNSADVYGGDIVASPYSGAPPTFDTLYTLDAKFKRGKYDTVWQGKSLETEKVYDIKVVEREHLSLADEGSVLNEVAMLKSLRHKYIVPLLDFFEDPDRFYLVMKKCSGGDVLDRVASLKQYSEKDARELAKGLMEAVEFIHGRGIAHRDLKPQNLLLETDCSNTAIQITDFRDAKRVHMPQSLTTLCGSLYYVAPELLKNHPYDETADNWSCGVILYFLLSGHLPFTGQDQQELFNNIRLGRYSFDDKYWCGISEEAVTLIKHLLDVDPSNRYTATQALQTDWINNADDAALGRRSLCRSRSSIAEQSSVKDVMRAAHWESYRRMSSLSDV